MSRFEILCDWQDPSPDEELVGPEGATWASTTFILDGRRISEHQYGTSVIGPVSGLVEWMVDHWLHLLWEIHPPFPKLAMARDAPIPGLREALQGWPGIAGEYASLNEMGAWQGRHTLGVAASDLALPSITILPERSMIGVLVDHPPTHRLNSPMRFSAEQFPLGPIWLAKDEFIHTCSDFIDATLARADQHETAKDWSAWLRTQWCAAQSRADTPVERRRLIYGPLVEEAWERLSRELGPRIEMLTGILLDCPPIHRRESLDKLIAELDGDRPSQGDRWRTFTDRPLIGLKPYQQGYHLAARMREHIGLHDEPVSDIRDLLDDLGIGTRSVGLDGLFRSAAAVTPEGHATLIRNDRVYPGAAPTRFSWAAALGRLVADGRSGSTAFGAAQGEQSNMVAGQRANAFAAEFLLPKAVVERSGPLDELCEEYGISRSAAEWHRRNRLSVAV